MQRLRFVEFPSDLDPLWSDPQRTTPMRQARLIGIRPNILNRPPQMLFIPKDAVVTLVLPQVPGSLQFSVDPSRAVLLPTAKDVLEGVQFGREGPHNRMGVIGHDHIASPLIAAAVDVMRGREQAG